MTSSNYSDRIPEGAGHVTSDSLAADSLRGNASRGFASNEPERGVAPSSQPSYSTTANTTDTSGADELGPARQRQDRLTETEVQGKNYQTPAEILGLDKFADSTYDTRGSTGGSTGGSAGSGLRNVGETPTVYHTGSRATEEQLKPKGKNLHEVSTFEGEERAPNASFQHTDIESEDDPGRQATAAFKYRENHPAMDSGYSGNKQGYQGGQGGFEQLDSDRAA